MNTPTYMHSTRTPGPWTYSSGMVWAGNGEEIPIAMMDRETSRTSPVERDRNAEFIAQAPAMLSALNDLLDLYYSGKLRAGTGHMVEAGAKMEKARRLLALTDPQAATLRTWGVPKA